jgi:protocatechuate 3,4-dioxygenase beta subunit
VAEVAQLRFDELGECSGLMTDGAGQPLPGVEVSAWLTHDSVQQAGLMPGEGGASCITDRNGCYRLRGLVPGRWQVSGRTVDVEAGRPATLDVSKR